MSTSKKLKTSESKRIKFNSSWLLLFDSNETLISKWAKKDVNDQYYCICIICNARFSIDRGIDRLRQHAQTAKHVKNLSILNHTKILLKPSSTESPIAPRPSFSQPELSNSLALVPPASLPVETSNVPILSLFNPKDAAIRAELLWCMENVSSYSSVASCFGKKELFSVMFPGGVPENFSLSPSKARYIITEALGPHFKNMLLKDLENEDVLFCLLFDDTSNVKTKKEMQIRIRFWSHTENIIICRHLETYLIGSATGQILFDHLRKALDSNNLPLKRVLALGCDGPNVNKTVFNLFQENLKELKLKPLIDIGTCDLHIVHNAFLKGCECLSLDVSDFIVKVFYYFRHRDVRWEILESIQKELNLPQHKLIKHVETRWLSLGPAAEREEEQLPALEHYFLKYIPKKETSTLQKQNYRDIKTYLQNDLLKISLQFAVYSSKIFTTEFTLVMQKEEPLIHVLYSQLKTLILILLSNIIKKSALESISFHTNKIMELLEDPKNFLDLSEINIGERAKETLVSLPKVSKLNFLSKVQKFYVASVKHIVGKVKCFSTLKYFQCLIPENIKNSESVSYISKISKLLSLQNIDSDKLQCEWRLLQLDEKVRFFLNKDERIDTYWNHIFSLQSLVNYQSSKYPEIKRVVKNALAISHGNADVERGFSTSSKILTEDKTQMTERTLNAKLFILDGLKKYNKIIYKVPITDDLIKLARGAHSSYQMHLEREKFLAEKEIAKRAKDAENKAKEEAQLKDLREQKRTLKNLENDLESAEKEYKAARSDAESMQNALKNAMTKQTDQIVVKELFNSLDKLRFKEKETRTKVDKLQGKIRQKNSVLIESAVKKRHIKNTME